MDLQRNDDQELFRETTRRFLESTCPVPTVRQWAEKEPSGLPVRLVAAGGRARLDVAAGGRGRRRGQRLGPRPARPGTGGRGDGPAGVARARCCRPTWWPPPSASSGAEAQRSEVLPGIVSGRDRRHLVPGRARRRLVGRGRRPARPRRRPADGFVLDGVKAPVEAAARVRPPAGGRPGRRGAHPVPRARRTPRGHRLPAREPRPGPAVRHRPVRRGAPCRRRRWWARWAAPARTSSASSSWPWSCSAPRWWGPSTGCSTSPSSTPSTGTPSAGPWPRTRRSSTASPT